MAQELLYTTANSSCHQSVYRKRKPGSGVSKVAFKRNITKYLGESNRLHAMRGWLYSEDSA
ncbi:hypothetical protein AwDysgo_18510 [Bacteroidales bacterium]|nr:hypothetical protein AwDysgo_18510 [Bacteroidales bacterium]